MGFDAEREPRRCAILLVSDGSGATAEAVADAVTVQFPGVDFSIYRYPGVRTPEQVLAVVEEAAAADGIIVHTIVMSDIRRLLLRECRQRSIDHVDLIGPLLGQVSHRAEMRPLLRPGVSRGLSDEYFRRIEAIQYTVQHDDGQGLDTLHEADIVLVGVSRSSKTPLSIFLSMRGWKVANVPIVLGVDPPRVLQEIDQRRIIALMVDQERLVRIRRHRMEMLGTVDAGYATPEKVAEELAYFRRIVRRGYPWPIVNTTGKSIEEAAKEIIAVIEAQRQCASATTQHFTHTTHLRQRRGHHARAATHRRHKVDIAHDFHATPDGPGHFQRKHVWRFAQSRGNALRFGGTMLPQHVRTRRTQLGDALEHLVGGLGAKLGHRRQTAFACRRLEIVQGVDIEMLVNAANARRPQTRYAQHFHEAFGRLFLQLLEQRRTVALRQIAQQT